MTQQVLVFKNNLPSITVLRIFSQDISVVKPILERKIRQAPMMFVGMQLIIDISPLDADDKFTLNIKDIIIYLQSVGVRPVAIMSGSASLRRKFAETGFGALPILSSEKKQAPTKGITAEKNQLKDGENEEPRKTYEEAEKDTDVPDNIIIRQNVRSGQCVFARGDLTIVGTVSQGAEIIADGNIHVYGKLRGRAIAGAHGNTDATIFCQDLDAELVSIAGNYHQLEDSANEHRHKSIQILFNNNKICFFPL